MYSMIVHQLIHPGPVAGHHNPTPSLPLLLRNGSNASAAGFNPDSLQPLGNPRLC